MNPDAGWFDVDLARDYFGGRDRMSRKAVYNLIDQGLKVARVGRRVYFCRAWIDEFMQRAAVTSAAQDGPRG